MCISLCLILYTLLTLFSFLQKQWLQSLPWPNSDVASLRGRIQEMVATVSSLIVLGILSLHLPQNLLLLRSSLQFILIPRSSSKETKGKNVTKEKKVILVDLENSPALGNKSEINVLARDFAYLEFMDKEIMTLACLKQLRGDDKSLVERF